MQRTRKKKKKKKLMGIYFSGFLPSLGAEQNPKREVLGTRVCGQSCSEHRALSQVIKAFSSTAMFRSYLVFKRQ